MEFLIPIITSLIGLIAGYFLGKRGKIDSVRIEKGFELSETISNSARIINDNIDYLIEFYERTYNTNKFDPNHVANFQDHLNGLYENELTVIREIDEHVTVLEAASRKIDLYTKNSLSQDIINFRMHISFEYADGIGVTEYFQSMYERFLCDDFKDQKDELFNTIDSKLKKLKF